MGRIKEPDRDAFLDACSRMTHKELQSHYGVSSGTIAIWKARLRVPRTGRSHAPSKEALLAAGAGDLTDTEVGNYFGVSHTAVYYWRRLHGIPSRRQRIAEERKSKANRSKLRRRPARKETVAVRLNKYEIQELKDRSEQAGVSVSDLVRSVLFGDGGGDE